jgi:hypothetical protein
MIRDAAGLVQAVVWRRYSWRPGRQRIVRRTRWNCSFEVNSIKEKAEEESINKHDLLDQYSLLT